MSTQGAADASGNGSSAASPALAKRKASVKARENITAAAADPNGDDNDIYDLSDREKSKPAKKKVKVEPVDKSTPIFSNATSSASNAAQAISAKTAKPSGVRIGTVQRGADLLPVRAEQYQNGTVNYRVHKGDVAADVAARHSDFMKTKRQVGPAEIIFDQAVFPGMEDTSVSALSQAEKKRRVQGYMVTVNPDAIQSAPSSQAPAESLKPVTKLRLRTQATPALPTPKVGRTKSARKNKVKPLGSDMVVGRLKKQPHVEVYAFLKTYGAPPLEPKTGLKDEFCLEFTACFRVRIKENDEDTGASGDAPKITDVPAFKDIQFLETFVRDSEAETRAAVTATLLQRRSAKKAERGSDGEEIEDIIDIDQNFVASQQAARNRGTLANMSGGISTKGFTRGAKDYGVVDNSGESDSDDESKDILIKQLERKNKAQERELAKLHARVLELEGKKVPSTSLGFERIGNTTYDLMGSGANPGKLITKTWRTVRVGNTVYKEWEILAEAQVNMDNVGAITEKKTIDGDEYGKIPDGKHADKWITSPTLFADGEKSYVKWTLKEEIPDDEGFIL